MILKATSVYLLLNVNFLCGLQTGNHYATELHFLKPSTKTNYVCALFCRNSGE